VRWTMLLTAATAAGYPRMWHSLWKWSWRAVQLLSHSSWKGISTFSGSLLTSGTLSVGSLFLRPRLTPVSTYSHDRPRLQSRRAVSIPHTKIDDVKTQRFAHVTDRHESVALALRFRASCTCFSHAEAAFVRAWWHGGTKMVVIREKFINRVQLRSVNLVNTDCNRLQVAIGPRLHLISSQPLTSTSLCSLLMRSASHHRRITAVFICANIFDSDSILQ
jgi:hypothetical protein